jgi:2-polyprenyl-3-methyl-5-hydroxy-6-metoxy-1,4-benzoquinol methylase/predicted RNA-binding Zn-ribbon protein involved in translation (DUF1610 family)
MYEYTDNLPLYSCPACGSEQIRNWRRKVKQDIEYPIDACRICGFAWVNPRPTMDFINKYYANHGHVSLVNKIGASEPSVDSLLEQENIYPNSTVDAKRIVATILDLSSNRDNQKLLDVGCGYGFFSKSALESGFEVTALEIASHERQIARSMTGLEPIGSSFKDFQGKPESYDAVLMSQTLSSYAK